MKQVSPLAWVIVALAVIVIISYAHKVIVKKGKHRPPIHPPCPPCPDCPPRVTGLKITGITANNNLITVNGKKMSVSLVGKQNVGYIVTPQTTDPVSGQQTPIDITQWTFDQLFTGPLQASVSDLSIATVAPDPSNQYGFIVTSVDGASGTTQLTVIGTNLQGQVISVQDDITVSPASTTTSTSTSTTTTEAPATAPLVSGLSLQAGTPTDVVS